MYLCVSAAFVDFVLMSLCLNCLLKLTHTHKDRQRKEEDVTGDNQSPKAKLQNGRPQKCVSESQQRKKTNNTKNKEATS